MSDWDIVLRGGRVVDPESGLDAVHDVAIAGGRVARIGTGLAAPASYDVTGLVVSAGFIDLHSHAGDVAGARLQALDSTRPSAGIRHVLVNGTFVVRDGDIVPGALPGRPGPRLGPG